MGRAARWLRSLLGGKKDSKEQKDGTSTAFADERREKKRWSFKSARDSGEPAASGSGTAWLRSLYAERVNEQSKHAIAAAMAAAANAAVVQLSSNGRKTKIVGFSEWLAAVKIQRVFRGYLAKKALRALKALVKLQALVRGYLVRKQAAATFYSMQALIKVQATVRAKKCRAIFSSETTNLPRHRLSRSSRRPSYSVKDPYDEIFPISISSPLPNIGRISVPDSRFTLDKCRYSVTAQSTPRCFMPSTPAKSICGMAEGEFRRRFINSVNCPNYMNKTQSFEAKKRSQSAPKQRPEVPSKTKRLPLSELVIEQSRTSLSSIRTRKVEEEFSFKRAVVGRLDRSLELNREAERDFYLQMKR